MHFRLSRIKKWIFCEKLPKADFLCIHMYFVQINGQMSSFFCLFFFFFLFFFVEGGEGGGGGMGEGRRGLEGRGMVRVHKFSFFWSFSLVSAFE